MGGLFFRLLPGHAYTYGHEAGQLVLAHILLQGEGVAARFGEALVRQGQHLQVVNITRTITLGLAGLGVHQQYLVQ